MTERQKKLAKEYGPRFIARARIIQTQMLYLVSDACSIFTDGEWAYGADAITKFNEELDKLERIASARVEETLDEGEDFVDLYDKAVESVKRYI